MYIEKRPKTSEVVTHPRGAVPCYKVLSKHSLWKWELLECSNLCRVDVSIRLAFGVYNPHIQVENRHWSHDMFQLESFLEIYFSGFHHVEFMSVTPYRVYRICFKHGNSKSGKPHTHNMSISLTFHTTEVDSELVLAVGSTLVQPHFNMNSCRPDSLKLHFPHVKDLVQKALHLSFVPEEGSFVECINPMPLWYLHSEAQNGVASLQNLPIQNLILYIHTIYIYQWFGIIIPLSQVTLSPKPPLVFPACRTPLDVATNAGHLRVARCLLESRGARGAGHALPLPVLPQVRGSWSNVGMTTVYIFSVSPVFFLPARKSEMTLSWPSLYWKSHHQSVP